MPQSYKNTGPISCPAEIGRTRVKGKTVIVTGGSSGLGAAYVKAFAEAGAFVVNADLKPPEDQFIASSSLFVKCNVTTWTDQVTVFQTAISKSPSQGIDIVIANAGIFSEDLFFEGLDDPDPTAPNLKTLDVNITGVIYTAKLAAHYFHRQAQSGTGSFDNCLILKASIMGYIDTAGSVTYGVSKHAVRGLMCILRRRGVARVNVIAPWFTPTPIMPSAFQAAISEHFASQGSGFAEVEDAVRAVMRVATDTSVNGRALSNVPRSMHPSGYVDLDVDDFEDGALCDVLQKVANGLSYGEVLGKR